MAAPERLEHAPIGDAGGSDNAFPIKRMRAQFARIVLQPDDGGAIAPAGPGAPGLTRLRGRP